MPRECTIHGYYTNQRADCPGCERAPGYRTFTAFMAFPDTPRGHYDEELDVVAANKTSARALAREALARDYEEGLRIRRFTEHPGGLIL